MSEHEKWTEGEWTLEETRGELCPLIIHKDGRVIAQVLFGDDEDEPDINDPGEVLANAKVLYKAPAMYAMLKRLEWVKNDDGHLFCATCWRREIEGHAPDCELDALLKSCTGEV